MQCKVFYESWQMECCGTPFCVGDMIKWPVYTTTEKKWPDYIGEIEYCYEAHSSDLENISVLEGKVGAIKVLYETYAPSGDEPRLLVPVDGVTVPTKTAKGFEKYNNMNASGYIVELNGYAIRPAKAEDMIYW
ncbi:MAG: hypothetical protein K2P63_05985 [Lachnospiraceae bacterium]|nr:hypothetical protein [Lachnospiraceae bacterium]